MKTTETSQGTWLHRAAVRLFTLVLAVLVFWVLGFLVDDIRSMRGPEYGAVESRHLDKDLVSHRDRLEQQLAHIARQIANETEKQRVVGDSSRSLQQTIGQLIDLQKLGMQKSVSLSTEEQANFSASLNLFLENQRRYQALSQAVSTLIEQQQSLVREREELDRQIEGQRGPARREYEALLAKHRMKTATFQLAVLLPVLAGAVVLVVKRRTSLYWPLYLAFGAASLTKVALVVHEYFPSRYFKYVLIGGLLLVVMRLLVYFVRAVAFPKAQWLIKQYREAYERFLCPVCEYPIRIGPRRYLFWTRRTVNKLIVSSDRAAEEEPYTCPACGSRLFEACSACGKVRHALLPNCAHCGCEKAIT